MKKLLFLYVKLYINKKVDKSNDNPSNILKIYTSVNKFKMNKKGKKYIKKSSN